MTPHQHGKSGVFTAAEVALEQLRIRQACAIAEQHSPAKLLEDLAHLPGRHLASSLGGTDRLYP
jgi:hypothetical protein